MATPRDFYRELTSITKFEVVGAPKESERQLRIIGRVRGRAISRAWATQFVDALVDASTGNSRWSADVSRWYFKQNNETIWAWRIIIQVLEVPMESALDEVLRALRLSGRAATVGQPAVELEEIPLVAPNPQRNVVKNGKGATNIKEAGR